MTAFPKGWSISSVLVSGSGAGNTIGKIFVGAARPSLVLGADYSRVHTYGISSINGGVWLISTNGGSTWTNSYCYAIYYSNDTTGAIGTSWTALSNVTTMNDDFPLGNQGDTNFALLADPTTSKYIYVAGTERIVYRVDVGTTPNTWQLIRSPYLPGLPSTCAFTASQTAAPHMHADTRNMYWDTTTASLILTGDGGTYVRSQPSATVNLGDWSSLAGDLAITEVY